jgi:hypothetical protein
MDLAFLNHITKKQQAKVATKISKQKVASKSSNQNKQAKVATKISKQKEASKRSNQNKQAKELIERRKGPRPLSGARGQDPYPPFMFSIRDSKKVVAPTHRQDGEGPTYVLPCFFKSRRN